MQENKYPTSHTTAAPVSQPRTRRTPGGSTHLIIATDASIVPGHPGAGIAAVASNGTTWAGYLPTTCDITWAELKAIHAAITHNAHPHIVILSDNQGAVAIATGKVIPIQTRMRRLATQISALRTGRDINITWVRSHHGHPLNHAADTLAHQTRRIDAKTTATAAAAAAAAA